MKCVLGRLGEKKLDHLFFLFVHSKKVFGSNLWNKCNIPLAHRKWEAFIQQMASHFRGKKIFLSIVVRIMIATTAYAL